MQKLESRINSVELCELINQLRIEEKGEEAKELRHDSLMNKIRKEIETMKKLGLDNLQNFLEIKYTDSKGRSYPCYSLNASGMRQILNSESVYVRCKTEEYILKLEEQNKQLITSANEQNILLVEEKLLNVIETKIGSLTKEVMQDVTRLESLIGIRSKTVFDYSKFLKRSLGIRKINDDYERIKQILFYEFRITKWEELTYDDKVLDRIEELCQKFGKSRQRKLF